MEKEEKCFLFIASAIALKLNMGMNDDSQASGFS